MSLLDLFYILAVPALAWEITALLNINGDVDKLKQLQKKSEENPDEYLEVSKKMAWFILLTYGYTLWCAIGLLTINSPIFSALLVIGYVLPKGDAWFKVDAGISIVLISCAIYNHYYLQFDLLKYLGIL